MTTMRIPLWFFLLVSVSALTKKGSLVDKVNDRSDDETDPDGLSLFRDALHSLNMLDTLLGNVSAHYTVFAPTNQAIQNSPQFKLYMLGMNETIPRWHHNLRAAVRQHIIYEEKLNVTDIFDLHVTSLQSMRGTIAVDEFQQRISGATILYPDIHATNGVLHVVDQVISAKFMEHSFSALELQPEFGPDHLQRVAMTDVVDVANARDVLNVVREEGTTFIGCRIRAFNRMQEYLPQTINDTPNVKTGELMNETMAQENIHNFLEYIQIPKNYYREDMQNHHTELTVPVAKCGHMWVTKRDNKLCFNNGCVIETPDPREFLASNGVGYVLDKCQVCPGVAMMVLYASEYTVYNLKDSAQFFLASRWNLRDLRLSVGDGLDVTLFASINTGWNFFNLEDVTRLAGLKWQPHQWNLLSHFMVQGRFTAKDLLDRYNAEGPYNMTSLAGEPLEVDYNSQSKKVTVAGGDLFFPDIQGVDGMLHLSSQVPLPRSVTHTVYDMAKEDPNYSTHIALIDTVRLDTDMKRLLPLTTFYAPNESWEGKNLEISEIAEDVLENHMFEDLWWCDRLRQQAGNLTISLNKKEWDVTLNDEGMPCFQTTEEVEGKQPDISCVTECDILSRNGLVHYVDEPMLFRRHDINESALVDFGDEISIDTGSGGSPNVPTVVQRVQPTPINAPSASVPNGEGVGSGVASTVPVLVVSILSMLVACL